MNQFEFLPPNPRHHETRGLSLGIAAVLALLVWTAATASAHSTRDHNARVTTDSERTAFVDDVVSMNGPVLAAAFGNTPLSAGSAPAASASSPLRWPTIVQVQGTWSSAQSADGTELGHHYGAGLLNATFETATASKATSADGSLVLHRRQLISSTTYTHIDATGRQVPDTLVADLTFVYIADGDDLRVTFIGELSGGTGIFTDAEGYYDGSGTSMARPSGADSDTTVRYFAGTLGGELLLPHGG